MLFFHSRLALYALMAVLSVVVLIGHHNVPPLDRDEARFAQASKQMLQTGDYITVRFQDALRAKKPAGIYWFQSTFANFLGADDISSYRFVNLLALLASVFAHYSSMTLAQRLQQRHYFPVGFLFLVKPTLLKLILC